MIDSLIFLWYNNIIKAERRLIMFDIKTKTSDYMSIVLTHDCTRNCPFCIDKYRGCGLQITDEHFINALYYAKKQDIKDILLTGGEPTLHNRIMFYAKLVKDLGFRLILTSNADRPDILYYLDQYVDCFNFSHYGQPMPDYRMFSHADLTITKLLYKGGIDSKRKLDAFIDKYQEHYYLKFSTMTPITQWATDNNTNFVSRLKAEHITVFGEVPALIYRDCVIKRYDCTADAQTPVAQSLKCLVNGQISKTWEM